MLARLPLPPGTHRVLGPPVRVLDAPSSTLPDVQLVELHEFLSTPGMQPSALARYLDHHTPSTMRLTGTGTAGNGNGVTTWEVTLGLRRVPAAVAEDQLVATIAKAPGGGTAWRADAEVVWQAPHPKDLTVPTDVASAEVERTAVQPRPSVRTVRLRAGRELSAIVRTFDDLPVAVPGARFCPADLGVRLRLAFPARGSYPAIVATVDSCAYVHVTLGGRAAAVLNDRSAAGPGALSEELAAALGYLPTAVWR